MTVEERLRDRMHAAVDQLEIPDARERIAERLAVTPAARPTRRWRGPAVLAGVTACAAVAALLVVRTSDSSRPARGGTVVVPTAATATTPVPPTTAPTPTAAATTTAAPATVTADDLDGDGRADALTAETDGDTTTLRAALASGITSTLTFDTCDQGLLGVTVLDGQPLVVYDVCGASIRNARLATLVDGRLVALDRPDELVAVWDHESAGAPGATADVACRRVDGHDVLVVASSALVHADGSPLTDPSEVASLDPIDATRFRRTWTQRTYALAGGQLTVTAGTGGIGDPTVEQPGVLLDNTFSCLGIDPGVNAGSRGFALQPAPDGTTSSATADTTATSITATASGVPLSTVDWPSLAYPVECGGSTIGTAVAYPQPAPGVDLALVFVTCQAGAGSPPSAMLVYDRADSTTSPHLLQVLESYQEDWLPLPATVRAEGTDLAIEVYGYSNDQVTRCCPDLHLDLTWSWQDGRYTATTTPPTHA